MYCRNYTGTISQVLCREVYHTACVHIWESPLSIGGFTVCGWRNVYAQLLRL